MTNFKNSPSRTAFALLGASSLLLSSCGDRQIKSYDVPKEHAQAAAAEAAPEEAAPLAWTTPPVWKELPPGQMRYASFSAPSKNGVLDISITPLPGTADSMLANVNRWRGQLELAPVTENDLKGDIVSISGEKAVLFDMLSEKKLAGDFRKRTLASAVSHDGMQWFFKMTGDDAGVADQKDAFVRFLGTVKFHQHQETSKTEPAPQRVAPASETPAPGKESSSSEIPAGWTPKPPGQMLLAEYALSGEAGSVGKVTVSSFPGEVGGLVANVNRWRGQVGLPPQSPDDVQKSVTPLSVGALSGKVIDIEGKTPDGKPSRLVAVIVMRDGNSWIYKLIGDVAVVKQEKDRFIKFVQSSR